MTEILRKAVMPDTPAAMRAHMMAAPPAGHGADDMPMMPMADMTSRHDAMHEAGAEHQHTTTAGFAGAARKAFTPHELKLDDAGSIELAFAQFNVIDADGDVTLPGAFPVKNVPMSAYGHTSWDGALPVGRGTISESGDWAIFKGQFFMDTIAGRDTHATLKGLGELAEFSYGYNVLLGEPGTFDGKRVRILKSLDPFEVAPVLKGSGVGTHIRAIKSGAPASDAPYAEQFLRYSEGLPALLDRFKGHAAVRLAEGRKLSRSDRAAIEELIETLDEQVTSARELLVEPPPKGIDVTVEVLLAEAHRLGVPV